MFILNKNKSILMNNWKETIFFRSNDSLLIKLSLSSFEMISNFSTDKKHR